MRSSFWLFFYFCPLYKLQRCNNFKQEWGNFFLCASEISFTVFINWKNEKRKMKMLFTHRDRIFSIFSRSLSDYFFRFLTFFFPCFLRLVGPFPSLVSENWPCNPTAKCNADLPRIKISQTAYPKKFYTRLAEISTFVPFGTC